MDLAGRLAPEVVEVDLGRIVLVSLDGRLGYDDAGAVELAVRVRFLGDIELADPRGSLHIAVYRGFSEEFLARGDGNSEQPSACTLAFAEHRQIVIADVASHAFYAGTPALEALRAADVRALCATPLVTVAGKALGIVATHFHEPKAPDERQLDALKRVAKGTAALLESTTVPT